jgi:hypothetical protein
MLSPGSVERSIGSPCVAGSEMEGKVVFRRWSAAPSSTGLGMSSGNGKECCSSERSVNVWSLVIRVDQERTGHVCRECEALAFCA